MLLQSSLIAVVIASHLSFLKLRKDSPSYLLPLPQAHYQGVPTVETYG